jgi:hypothetical protein
MTSPRTNARLESKTLIPNVALRQQIDEFCKANGYSPPRPYYPPQRAPRQMTPDGVNDPCPHIPGWVLASLFLGIWLFAWAAGSTIYHPPTPSLSLSYSSFINPPYLFVFGCCPDARGVYCGEGSIEGTIGC